MKSLALVVLSFALFVSCSKSSTSEKNCPCRIKIPQLQKDGSYKLEVVEVQTLESLNKIKGSKIHVTLNPVLAMDGTVEDTTPEAQYMVREDNVIIPTRAETAQMFSIYKAMEDLYFFDQLTGADKFLEYPRVVSLQTRSVRAKKIANNACYVPTHDRIVIFKYEGDQVALGLNPGIIAHEHFHAIFSTIVNPLKNTLDGSVWTSPLVSDDLPNDHVVVNHDPNKSTAPAAGYNYLILKSLDEGLADFWAHIHTGLENAYLASYRPEDMIGRSVLPWIYQLESQSKLIDMLSFGVFREESYEVIEGKSRRVHETVYAKGTNYSNLLKSISEKIKPKERDTRTRKLIIGQWIVKSLKKLSVVVEAKGKKEILTQAEILENFIPEDQTNDDFAAVCEDFNLFLSNHNKVPSCSGY